VSPLRVLAISAVVALFAKGAAADEGTTEMQQAVADFTAAEQALATSPPCETMCKALQSMARAAERICELAKGGGPIDQKRCVDAKAKVEEATTRVRASCPDCTTAKPEAPATATTKPAVTPMEPTPPPPAPGKSMDDDRVSESSVSAMGAGRHSSVLLDVLPLFLPPAMVQPRLVRQVGKHSAFAVTIGLGSLPKTDGVTSSRTSAFVIGGELRVIVLGRFDGISAFVGADFAYREAGLDYGQHLTARGFPLGFVLGPELGTRLVTEGGLTIEARAGVDFVVQDLRGQNAPTDKVLPLGAISLGWSF